MKRIILTLLVAFSISSIYAQLNGNGFYRIKNRNSGRNITIVNDKIHRDSKAEIKDDISRNMAFDIYALETKKETISDPGSILYIEHVSGSEYNIKGQGMYTKTLTAGRTLKIYKPTDTDYYNLYASEEGLSFYLNDKNYATQTPDYGVCCIMNSDETHKNGMYKWDVTPINDNNYLGINPEITVGDKYYTTFYAGYAIQLSSGMKAYYVKEVKGKAAELVETGSDIVPEATPVIIECSSKSPSSNKVTPLASGGTKLTGNLLKGVYFSYVMLNGRRTGEATTSPYYNKLKNATENKGTIRILGVVDGKLSLVKATEADLYMKKYLPANKAYLEVINTAESNLTLLEGDAYKEATGINSIRLNEESQGVYNLKGQKVPSTDDLPKGIYIIDGKKVTKN